MWTLNYTNQKSAFFKLTFRSQTCTQWNWNSVQNHYSKGFSSTSSSPSCCHCLQHIFAKMNLVGPLILYSGHKGLQSKGEVEKTHSSGVVVPNVAWIQSTIGRLQIPYDYMNVDIIKKERNTSHPPGPHAQAAPHASRNRGMHRDLGKGMWLIV